MATTTLTSEGLDYIASLLYDNSGDHLYIAVGQGTPSSSGLGDEHTSLGFSRTEPTATYATGRATITHTFTATGGSVQVTEAGLYAGTTFIGHVHFGEFDLRNGGVVPDGASIPITFTIDVTPGAFSVSSNESGSPVTVTYTGSASVVLTGSGTINPDAFVCNTGLCFNGNAIRNGYISDCSESRGGKVWSITGYTTSQSDIDNLKFYCAPISISRTITGLFSIGSILLPGTFRIYNKSTHSYDIYSRCWISSDISVETFGEGYWFNFSISQDYQGTKTSGGGS